MPTTSPNLGLTIPTVGGDVGVWGNELNTSLLILDNLGLLQSTSPNVSSTLAYGTFPIGLSFVTAGAAGVTITLPTAVGNVGRGFTIKKVDAGVGAVTIVTSLGQTIDGIANYMLVNQFQFVTVVSDGANFQVVGAG